MSVSRANLIRLLVLSLLSGFQSARGATRDFPVASFDQEKIGFNAYHSYQKKFILLSFVNRSENHFDCQPNRYVIYQYAKEELTDFRAANLVVNSEFTLAFFAHVRGFAGYSSKNRNRWKRRIEQLLTRLKVTTPTLEKGKMIGRIGGGNCWIQPSVLRLNNYSIKRFPFLMANQCRSLWCSDFFWKDKTHVHFWAQISPDFFHLVRLNVSDDAIKILKKKKIQYSSAMSQENAPRENLVHSGNLKGKVIHITTGEKSWLKLSWRQEGKKVEVKLSRNRADGKNAKRIVFESNVLLKKKKPAEALSKADFARWISLGGSASNFARIKVFAAMRQYDNVFNSLKVDFTDKEKPDYCKKIHVDKFFESMRAAPDFSEKFKKACF